MSPTRRISTPGDEPAAPPPGAEAFLPATRTLPTLQKAVQGCRGCDLYREATQAVFGEGMPDARIMLIGEQPGDAEDRAGHPFVGPAGKLLGDALRAAGIPGDATYITNVVKHFKFTRRGKKRIHDRPNRYEREACKPWLGAEQHDDLRPHQLELGASAAQTLLGSSFRVTQMRGRILETALARYTIASVHPSSVLRAPDEDSRREARDAFFADMRVVADCYRALGSIRSARRPRPE